MNIVILDDYQDAVRKLSCASKLEAYSAKVHTNTVKGMGQLSVRLKDADIVVLIRERTHLTRAIIDKLPRLKLIVQTGRVGSHVDVQACTERGIAVAEGSGSPFSTAELTWALVMAAMRLRHCPRRRRLSDASPGIGALPETTHFRRYVQVLPKSAADPATKRAAP